MRRPGHLVPVGACNFKGFFDASQFKEATKSASGYKQTSRGLRQSVRFTPESRHSEAQERLGLKKRTLGEVPANDRFWPKADLRERLESTQIGHST